MTVNTERLIESLSQNVPPVSRRALSRRIRYGICGGGIVATIPVVALLGVRPDLAQAVRSFPFWMKCSYTVSVGVFAVIAVGQLARPTSASLRALWLLAIPVLLLAGIGIGELASTPSSEWLTIWLARSWLRCPPLVLALATPIFIGLLWAFRTLAPLQARAAGAAAGLAAGAWAATIYGLYCPEVSAIFVLTWYSLGIVLATAAGALLGPRLMRW
jgi:hypothetical protein